MSGVEIQISQDEQQFMDLLLIDEKVHNAIGASLTLFRESLMEQRNRFMMHLAKKYRLENPKMLTYDRMRKMIVSANDPNIHVFNLELTQHLKQLADSILIESIKTLRAAEGVRKG